ncbi:TPA_asm: ead/Ea22-like family protein [Salmonella enterica subsp. enterica serovar Newport]|uniref:Ead/Ea22-like family protein n=1 Tax=Salmonella newport TaxID=108619 RepID=A0A728MMZ6_SALNE|nr:ead/Ea22-like family protein [Salmonella enterica]HAE2741416.1 ead/Ea22-like family protein [Salmonella enterica subsp. enterica serovar Newport]EAT7786953.1 ead/Ea22-like family protein [Salmonella enterica]EAV7993381.1 ead/Ea22-like family protein [Salmonella enterica]EBF3113151.1 ead/Ea22-like family protein [Salmonella enterica]
MTIDKQALLVSKAKASVFTMRYISQFEASDIDSDDIDLRFEVDGTETGTTVSIVDECGHAAQIITALLDELEAETGYREGAFIACNRWHDKFRETEDKLECAERRIAELEAKLETADKLQDSAFRDGLKAGFSYGQTDDQSGFAQCMSAYSTRAGIGVKQQEDSVDSDVGRNQLGMVVAVHIGAGDFVKVKGQVFEVEETDFDDHDVTLWFVGGNALKCAAGCPVEVVSAPVAAIKVKG